jgi:hypothetical protein
MRLNHAVSRVGDLASMGIGPSSSHEGTMSPKDRLGRDDGGCPPLTRDEACEGTDDRSIRPGEARTGGLALVDDSVPTVAAL